MLAKDLLRHKCCGSIIKMKIMRVLLDNTLQNERFVFIIPLSIVAAIACLQSTWETPFIKSSFANLSQEDQLLVCQVSWLTDVVRLAIQSKDM